MSTSSDLTSGDVCPICRGSAYRRDHHPETVVLVACPRCGAYKISKAEAARWATLTWSDAERAAVLAAIRKANDKDRLYDASARTPVQDSYRLLAQLPR